jgi:non-specific serine/threonine protein kinase
MIASDAQPAAATARPPTNLPLETTSFIGRERETAAVERLLATTRLLTLTGAGGCGKTRLALHVAASVRGAYPDGVWFVELAALADAALVAQSAAATLGVRERTGAAPIDALASALRAKSLLIVLDNCEHLVGAAAHLADALLRRCPNVRILATSREALGCAGEVAWRVPSLPVPPAAVGDAARPPAEYEAVQLFADRARAVRPAFRVSDENMQAVAEICRHLDGIPLAIELAAARVGVLSPAQIAARLDDRFRLLTAGRRTATPRQQTLRATVDWSHQLLAEPERVVLRRLSVFAGGWTVEAAEVVAAGDGLQTHAILELLAQLVEKSLVLAEEEGGAVRYGLLETIRQYAHEKLVEAGEVERLRGRHLVYFLALAEEAEPAMRGPEAPDFMDRLEREHDNLRAALEWALSDPTSDAALRLSGALAWFWWARSHHTEGRRWLTRALSARPDPSAARMKALHGAAWLAHHQRDGATARELLEESLAIARGLSDRWTVAWTLHCLGRVTYFENDPATTRRLADESLAVAEEAGDRWLIAWALHLRGIAAYIAADYVAARGYYERSLAIRRELGFLEGIMVLLGLLGMTAFREADFARARTLFRESLAVERGMGGPWNFAMIFAYFASLASSQGDATRAVRLAGAATALSEAHHTPIIPLIEAALTEELSRSRRALDEVAFAAAWAEGRAQPLEAAIAEALAVEVRPAAARPAPAPAPRSRSAAAALTPTESEPMRRPIVPAVASQRAIAALTPTERRILRLLATGRTTKEIAAELVVAISTVDRHITHIYQKLGVRNRAAAVALASQHELA